MRWVVALALLGCGSGCTWGALDPQEVLARSLRPAQVGPIAAPGTKARRTLKARVWADRGHIRSVLGWQDRFRRQLAGANRVLLATLGVEIEVVSMSTWDHMGGRASLQPDLRALAEVDDGSGADFVIGLVSPLAVFSPTFEDLGRAQLLGKHMVLRGIEDADEHRWMAEALDERPSEEREALYQARLRHREVALLLHEVGHGLGAIHVWSDDFIMAQAATHDQGGFSAENLALMGLSLEARTTEAPASPQVRAALAAHLNASKWDGWRKEAKAVLLSTLGQARPQARPETDTLPPPDADPVTRARWWLSRGQAEAAWDAIAPRLEALGDEPAVVAIACEAAVRKAPASKPALRWCRRLAEAEPKQASSHLLHAMALHGAKKIAPALAAVRRAEAAIEAAEAKDRPRLWTWVAQTYQRMDALTWAIESAPQGEPEAAGQVADYVRRVRAELGAKDGKLGVPPEDEPAFVGLMRALRRALGADDEAAVSKLTATLARRFPKVAGPHVKVCQHFGELERWASAQRFCAAATRRAPRAPQPHLVLGVAAFAGGRPSKAVRSLERAIERGPDAKDGWTLLYAAYRATGRAKKAAGLAARYRARFGQPLQ